VHLLKNQIALLALILALSTQAPAEAQPTWTTPNSTSIPTQATDSPAPENTTPAPAIANAPSSTRPSASAPSAGAPGSESPKVTVAPGRGVTITSPSGDYAINLRARVQLRAAFTTHEERPNDLEASIRTARFFVAGHLLVPELKYLMQLALANNDFERDNASPIFDAFLEYVAIRDLNIRVGQFFVPFDRARTIREFALQFVDRQTVVRELSLDRDFGLMLSSQDLFGTGVLGYNLFLGSGDGRNRVLDAKNPNGPQKPGVLLVGRVTVRPFGAFDDDQEADLTRDARPRLAIGVAGGYNVRSNRDRSTLGATYTAGTFDYVHAAADLVFKWHGLSLLGEFLYRAADHRSNGTMPATGMPVVESSRSGYGYLAQAGQMLTQHVEVVARWEQLFAREPTDRALVDLADYGGRQLGGGVNVYLNGHLLKLQSDYFWVSGPKSGREQHIARLQLDASF
jgi:phosphate-selective porin OprO and OprP